MDIIKEELSNNKIIAGLATGYRKESKTSFYRTEHYSNEQVKNSRFCLEQYISNQYNSSNLRFYYQKQKHTDKVLKITKDNISTDQVSDSVITNEQNIILNASVADCTAIIIYHNIINVVGLAHSGWRGSTMNIAAKTVYMMQNEYNIKARDLNAVLLASASQNNYEVGREFMEYFPNNTVRYKNNYYYNNKNKIREQLIEAGLNKNRIKVNVQCTISNKRYHSFRRDGLKSGRMNAYVGIIS